MGGLFAPPISSGAAVRLTDVASKFDIRTLALDPGETLPYDDADWRDALVRVEQGEIVLQMRCGRACYFRQGDTLWLTGLPLVSIHNRGGEPAVLIATARQTEMR